MAGPFTNKDGEEYTREVTWNGYDANLKPEVVDVLNRAQQLVDFPIVLISGYRDPARNAAAGGAKKSMHMQGAAADVSLKGLSNEQRTQLTRAFAQSGAKRLGAYTGNTAIHLDMATGYAPQKGYSAYAMFDRTRHKMDSAPQWFKAGLDGGKIPSVNVPGTNRPRPQVMPAMLRTPNSADEVVRDFEDFRSEPYMDNGSWRVGFGSDTITRRDGTVERVKPGMTVTREAAQRDLERRLPEFEQAIIKQVGTEAWNKLPREAQSAVKSMAYNYGSLGGLPSLVTAIKSGDLSNVADEVEARGSDNKGINRKRRTAEAALIRKGIAPTPAPRLASRTPTATAPQPRTATLANGNPVEIGKVYRIGDNTYVGGVDDKGVGTLKKADPGILKEAGKDTIVGGIVDATVRQMAGDGARQARPAAGAAVRSAANTVSGAASKVAGAVGNLAGGPSAALASALERLGRASLAKKGPVTVADVAPKPRTPMREPYSSTSTRSFTVQSERNGARPAVMPVPQGIAASVPQRTIKATSPKPTQAQMQAMRNVPKYLTKTRRVPIENEKKVAENNSLSAVPRGVVMNSLSRDSVAQRAAGAAAAKQLFRTETYQVPNPEFTEITVPYEAPAGPTPAQIKAERLAELRRIREAYEAQLAAQRQQAKFLTNTTAEHRAALESGSKSYTPSGGGGRVMPTRTISGKVRNSYGDSGGSSPYNSNGSLV